MHNKLNTGEIFYKRVKTMKYYIQAFQQIFLLNNGSKCFEEHSSRVGGYFSE